MILSVFSIICIGISYFIIGFSIRQEFIKPSDKNPVDYPAYFEVTTRSKILGWFLFFCWLPACIVVVIFMLAEGFYRVSTRRIRNMFSYKIHIDEKNCL